MKGPEAQGARVTILLAEDDPTICHILDAALQTRGYEVSSVTTVDQALGCLTERSFDLVITDYLMPGGGGMAILQQALCQTPRPVIIMVTGLTNDGLYQELEYQGVDCVLGKPFRLALLLDTIEKLLTQRVQATVA